MFNNMIVNQQTNCVWFTSFKSTYLQEALVMLIHIPSITTDYYNYLENAIGTDEAIHISRWEQLQAHNTDTAE